MRSAKIGWAVGARGALLEYQAGRWTPLPRLTDHALHQVVVVPHSTEAWAIGDGGAVLHYRQGQWSTSTITAL